MRPSKARVLVVDDEESIRRLVSLTLQIEGYSCILATNGHEALETASQQQFDVVLLDVKMPGISGLEVLAKLRGTHPNTRFIVVTAMADSDTVAKAIKLGADDFIAKPLDLDVLEESVKRVLASGTTRTISVQGAVDEEGRAINGQDTCSAGGRRAQYS